MGRNKKATTLVKIDAEIGDLSENYLKNLEQDPKYSLLVDPSDKYKMPDLQKEFIKHYVNYKNLDVAADLTGIDLDTARHYFVSYDSQQEIRRINRALYHRQFGAKLMDIDQIGGYLTCLIKDEVPYGDRIPVKEKIKVLDLLLKVNMLKQEGIQDPKIILNQDLDVQLKNLSIDTIKNLLETHNQKNNSKEQLTGLTPEENAYLNGLSSEELLSLIEINNSKGTKNE